MDYLKIAWKIISFIPFLSFLLLFAGFSALLTIVKDWDMRGKTFVIAVLKAGALVGIAGSRLFGKAYQ